MIVQTTGRLPYPLLMVLALGCSASHLPAEEIDVGIEGLRDGELAFVPLDDRHRLPIVPGVAGGWWLRLLLQSRPGDSVPWSVRASLRVDGEELLPSVPITSHPSAVEGAGLAVFPFHGLESAFDEHYGQVAHLTLSLSSPTGAEVRAERDVILAEDCSRSGCGPLQQCLGLCWACERECEDP